MKKSHGLIIIGLLCLFSLFWGFFAALKWDKLLSNDNYLFFAKVLVGLLQGAGGFFIVYALLYWMVCRIRLGQH